MNKADPTQFRKRMRESERLVGTFIKTPTSHTTEIMGELASISS